MRTNKLPGSIVAMKSQMDLMLRLMFERMDADAAHIEELEDERNAFEGSFIAATKRIAELEAAS